MRALVTGSSGFLGRHFTARLRDDGYRVLPIDIADRKHPNDCRTVFRTNLPFDLVVHCAAVIPNAAERVSHPMAVAQNLELDAAMFRWALATKPGQVVYFSSAAAYPVELVRKLHENDIDLDDLRQPDSMYGLVKLVGEVQARDAQRAGLDVLVVRPQSGYGADQSLDYPFRSILTRARQHMIPLTVWGSGHQFRDFIHVDDVVGATMALLASKERRPVNIGTGVRTTMIELAEMAAHAAGDPSPVIVPDRTKPEGAKGRVADVERLRAVYTPQIALEQGVKRALVGQ